MGSFIKDGNTDEYDMGEYLSREEQPRYSDFKKGYVSLANNRFASDNFKHRSSLHEIVTARSYRISNMIEERIAKKHKFNFDSMK